MPGGPRDEAPARRAPVAAAWSLPARGVLEALDVVPARGLDGADVARRRLLYGENALARRRRVSALSILVDQLRSLLLGLLAAAAAAAYAFGQAMEGSAILVVILLNTIMGFVVELKAVRSMEALRRLGDRGATVRRGGSLAEISARELVPGDVVVLEAGDVVTADMRLIEASRLQVDESTLTGESLPVGKRLDPLPEVTVVSDRRNMLFKGTAITRGAGEAVVTATGMATELGRISSLVAEASDGPTPLERHLDRLGRRLMFVALGFAALIALGGLATGKPLLPLLETAIALAVATVPEGLPIVATLALARGMWRMARRNALMNELAAVETLGSTTMIVTDKTGTLTENRMTVVEVDVGGVADPERARRHALEVCALCNDADLGSGGEGVGDPLEVALLRAAVDAGLDLDDLSARHPELREEAFDPSLRLMATVHRSGEGTLVAVKGAPEAVLARSKATEIERRGWLAINERMAKAGLRVLAAAERHGEDPAEDPYRDLEVVALVGLLDPPRTDVRSAVEACRRAGVRVVMLTGDQAATAASVAQATGIVDAEDVEVAVGDGWTRLVDLSAADRSRLIASLAVARTSPEQKLELICAQQEAGEVVAMIGDGVNDAPALRKADIGVAMGLRGTQVAREAADMVLADDRFSTIVVAIEQGRVIYDNIRKFVVYLLSCNLSEILVVGCAALVDVPLPVLPLQILFLNLVTDVFPALALGGGEGTAAVMERPPRPPQESMLTAGHWRAIGGYAVLLTTATLFAYGLALHGLGLDDHRAVTVAFLALGLAQTLHVFDMAGYDSRVFVNEVTRNPWVWGAVLVCGLLLVAAVEVPLLSQVLGTGDPGLDGWLLVLVAGLLPVLVGRAWHLARRVVNVGGPRREPHPAQDPPSSTSKGWDSVGIR